MAAQSYAGKWAIQKLADVVDEIMTGPFGTMLHKSDYIANGIPVINPQNIVDGQIIPLAKTAISQETYSQLQKYALRENDIVMARRGEMGRCAIVTKESAGWLCGTGSLVIRLKPFLNHTFINTYLQSDVVKSLLQKESVGATMDNLNQSILNEIPIPIPPLPEQKRIVAILDEAFAAIAKAKENAEKNLRNAKELFESYLQGVFANPGEGWEEKKLGEICEVQSGGTPLRSIETYWQAGKIPWYSSGELNNLFTKASERYITAEGLRNSNAKLYPNGSLLIGMYDTAALKMSILDRDAAFNQAIAGVKPNKTVELIFILHAINANKPQILDLRRGVRQKNLSLEKIKGIALAVPSIEVQRAIVAKLDAVSAETKKLEVIQQQKLADLEELKKSILQKAFRGELTAR